MRSLYPVIVTISIAVSVLIIQMSGLPNIMMGGSQVSEVRADDEFKKSVKQHNISAEGAPGSQDDGGFFQFVTGGLSKAIDFATLVILLPETLTALDPMPWFVAYPLGLAGQSVVIIGIAEAAAGRVWN